MMKVLIVGLGSIGQRHANALLSFDVENIAALRTNKGQKEIDNTFHNRIKMFYDEEEAFNWQPTHLIISNPTSLHLHFIKKAIDLNIKFFVEKPISDKLEDIDIDEEHSIVNGVVGYNLRFHGMFQFIKDIIVSGKYGRAYTAHLHVGQYLPNWHPYEDYRDAYYAKAALGGGALRTLSHEVDIMQFIFGKVKAVYAKIQKLSDLEIDVDDVTNIFAETEICKQVSVHINFLDPKIKRTGSIYLSEGVLSYDFVKSEVTFTENDGKETIIYSTNENINTQYELQMQEFLTDNISNHACSFEGGLEVLRIIENCIQSNNEKREICLI